MRHTSAEAKRLEARHEDKLKLSAAAEAGAAEDRSRAEAIPVSSVLSGTQTKELTASAPPATGKRCIS